MHPELHQYAPFVKAERSWVGQDGRGPVLVKWGDFDRSPWPGGPRVLATAGPPSFLVREFYPGPSLQESAPLSPVAAVELFSQVLTTLTRMHQHGVVHGRLKPSNVFAAGLTDAGLAVDEVEPSAVLFRAPELSGARSADIGPAVDLYSAGACLCYMLTGQPPYQARDLSEAVRAPFLQPLPSLHRPNDPLLIGLDAMMVRLMSVDPAERYASAAEALADLQRLRQAPESFVCGAYEMRDRLALPTLAGRLDLLSALSHHLDRGGQLQLIGEAGSGKSRLAEQARRMARARGHLVLRGRARQQMADAPLQVLDEICQELLSQRDPGEFQRVLADLGDWRPLVGTALPALGGPDHHGPDAHAWSRTRQALSVFLGVLGTPQRPALLILEDLHWCPPDVLELLEGLTSSSHVAILITSRRELSGLPGQREHLGALASTDIERMTHSMLGRCQPDHLQVVSRVSEGNPYRLVSLLKQWVRQGVLQPTAEGWTAPKGLPSSPWAPAPAREIDGSTREILSVAAVVGREIELDLLCHLFETDSVRAALLAGVSMGLVESPGPESWAFAHDLAREAVLGWEPAGRPARHLRVAHALCRQSPPSAPEVAYHFHRAGDYASALPFARLAAAQARERQALSAAETYLSIALAGAPEEAGLWEEMGDVQRIAGRFQAAEQSYGRSLLLAREPLQRARILGGQAEAAFGEGHLNAARDRFREALELLGHSLPKGRWGRNLALLKELTKLLVPRRGAGELEPAQRLASVLLDRLAYVLVYSDGYGLIWANMRCLNLTRGAAPGREMGTALVTHAVATLYVPPLVDRCRGLAKQACELLERHGSEYQLASATARAATIELFLDNPAEAARLDEWAVPVLKRSGDRYDAHMSAYNLGLAYYFVGKLEQARGVLKENLVECLAVGDSLGCGFSMRVLGLLGPLTEEQISQIPLNPAFPSASILLDEVRGLHHLQRGEYQTAIGHLEHGSRLARGSGDVFEDFWTALFLIRARRLQSLREQGPYRAALEKLVEQEGARIGRLAAKGYKVFVPRVCREMALLRIQQGSLEEAGGLLRRALKAAQDCGMRYEEALAFSELAELGRLSGVGAEREASEASRLFRLTGSTWERSHTVSVSAGAALVERFDQVVFWTQSIASQQSAHQVVETARQACEALLRCRSVRLCIESCDSEVSTVEPRESTTLSALSIPLPWAEEEGTELYCVSEEAESHFGAEELRLASLIQGQARVALSLADVSQRRLERIAVFQDRERHLLASEVHDVLSQPLVAMQLQLEALARQHHSAEGALREAGAAARGVLDGSRDLIARLRSPHIERLCLSRAIEDAVYDLTSGKIRGVSVELDPGVDGLPPLPTLFTYRIVVEALTNCSRHAQAGQVRVRLRVQGARLLGVVADDGVGFARGEVASSRYGLRILVERAELLGGRASVRSAPGQGTAVLFQLPTARS